MLIIMDGWGLGDGLEPEGNAIAQAHTPNIDRLLEQYPSTSLTASGEAVGLPAGQMGNSEVGHLNIGAGRVVYQDLTRINQAIAKGSFRANPVLNEACEAVKASGKALHLLGLVSDGGVHSQLDHLYALLEVAKAHQLPKVFVHALLDGRDTPPTSGLQYMEELENKLQKEGLGKVATVCGRYYSMDRDQRWERVAKGYHLMFAGEGLHAYSGTQAVANAYDRGETDEFVEPTVIMTADNQPVGTIEPGDSLIMFNYRTDRLRQMSHAIVDEDFAGFDRSKSGQDKAGQGNSGQGNPPPDIKLYTMTQYDASLPVPVLFPPQSMVNTLGEVVGRLGLRQLRIAETEKYAHVTFFFNGGQETPNPLEDRILIPSPKVATYDLQPEMSAAEVGQRVNEEIRKGIYDLIVLNYANPDMVGHTGSIPATIKAVETVDYWVGQNVAEVLEQGGVVLIMADHGNAETMRLPGTCNVCTAHSCQPVPFILVGKDFVGRKLRSCGALEDVAPTILELLDIVQPEEMTGRSLLD
jgi:2,3-bisphosphoglycerate-independent phosphoglycerate mutase